MRDKQQVCNAIHVAIPELECTQDAELLQTFGVDWTGGYVPDPLLVTFPTDINQVQHLVLFANQHQLSLVPSGGRTGLSAGAVAAQQEIVVSFAKMQRILHVDPVDRLVTCEAGVITQTLQDYARAQNLYFPVDFASRGSSYIGGNIATNAGGINVLRYGLLRDWVAGLTVVTGKGDILNLNAGLIKNATGYDLRHLFVGSEGTLGLIVTAQLRLTALPPPQQVMVLALPALRHIIDLLLLFRSHVTLSAFEFFSDAALQHVLQHNNRPFATQTPFYVLLEFDAATAQQQEAALNAFTFAMEQHWINDGVVSQTGKQAEQLWKLRENISETIAKYHPYKNDIAVKPSQVVAFLQDLDEVMQQHYPDFAVVWFGHIGDGNLHLNVLKPAQLSMADFVLHCQQVNRLVFATVQKYQGSISAEHGVGLLKQPYLHYTRDPAEIAYLQAIKAAFDPKGILNPGKLLP